jgi:hypothetical protein
MAGRNHPLIHEFDGYNLPGTDVAAAIHLTLNQALISNVDIAIESKRSTFNEKKTKANSEHVNIKPEICIEATRHCGQQAGRGTTCAYLNRRE